MSESPSIPTAQDPGPQDPEVTTGMATGSDAGAPGDHPAPGPLDEAEQDLLDDLRHDDAPEVVQPLEDGAAMAEAADADSVLPGAGRSGGPEEDSPAFVEPV